MGFLREVPSIEALLGFLISYSSTAMNSGKTRNLDDDRDIAKIAGLNVRVFSPTDNVRDGGNCMRVNEGSPTPALSVVSPLEIIAEIERLDKLLDCVPNKPGEKYTDATGEDYFIGRPISVNLIDEAQLFTLSAKGTEEMLRLVDYCHDKHKALAISCLLENARQEPFGNIYEVNRRAQYKRETSARCKMDRQGHICGNSAIHTKKLWRLDKRTPEMQKLLTEMSKVAWWTKGDQRFSDLHVSAPYFSPVVEIEEDMTTPDIEKPFSYVPICDDCLRANPSPFREEFFAVYDSILKGKDPLNVNEHLLIKAILENLLEDNWIRKEKGGLFLPVPHYRGQFGIYTPELHSKDNSPVI